MKKMLEGVGVSQNPVESFRPEGLSTKLVYL
jgi:hypothetical protein